MLTVAFAQARQEVCNVLGSDVADFGQPVASQRCRVPQQVAPVCLQGVRGQSALDRQMIQIAPDGAGNSCQLSTSAGVTAGRLWASATGAQMTMPS
jgi:hypothetical protein